METVSKRTWDLFHHLGAYRGCFQAARHVCLPVWALTLLLLLSHFLASNNQELAGLECLANVSVYVVQRQFSSIWDFLLHIFYCLLLLNALGNWVLGVIDSVKCLLTDRKGPRAKQYLRQRIKPKKRKRIVGTTILGHRLHQQKDPALIIERVDIKVASRLWVKWDIGIDIDCL